MQHILTCEIHYPMRIPDMSSFGFADVLDQQPDSEKPVD